MTEEWREVPGSNGRYWIAIDTKQGRCVSLNYRGHKGVIKELSNRPNTQTGRIIWNLYINGKGQTQQAARWIAITYPELVQNEYFEGAVIDHINTDVEDNRPENLRWVTPKENSNNPLTLLHSSIGHTGIRASQKTRQKQRDLNPRNKKVSQLTLDDEIVQTFQSLREAERQTGIPSSNICICCKNPSRTIGGYKWRYA